MVDPAIGDGELLVRLINKLIDYGIETINVYGFDTNERSIAITRERLQSLYPEVSLHLMTGDFLEFCVKKI